jgi:hypothetical protein
MVVALDVIFTLGLFAQAHALSFTKGAHFDVAYVQIKVCDCVICCAAAASFN